MRRFLLLFALLPLLSLGAAAQGFQVAGQVVDAITGIPLARATVTLEALPEALPGSGNDSPASANSSPAAQEVTTSEGRFHFHGLLTGRYLLRASRRGYLISSFEEHGRFFAAVLVGPGKPPAMIRFPLLPLASIEGTVLDSTGDPVQGATVDLFMQSSDGSGSIRANQATSLQRGGSTYEFHSLAPGTYYVAVTARPWFAAGSSASDGGFDPLDVAYPVTFYPGAESEATAQPIALQAGEHARADFALHAVPAVHINVPAESGVAPRVTASAFGASLPLNTGIVHSQLSNGEDAPVVFSTSVAPGVYNMRRGTETTAIDASGKVTTVPPPSAEPLPASVTGRLAMADGGQLPAGTALRLLPGLPGGVDGGGDFPGALFGQRAGGFAPHGGGRGRGGNPGFARRPMDAVVGADGSFRLEGVMPGDYRLEITAGRAGSLVVTAAAAAGTGTPGSNLPAFHMGTDPVMLAATIAPASSSVNGRVVGPDGVAESGDMVLLVPQDRTAAMLYKQEESNSDGSWEMTGVAAGVYQVIAIRDGWSLAWRKADVLSKYLGSSATVTVPTASQAALEQPVVAQRR